VHEEGYRVEVGPKVGQGAGQDVGQGRDGDAGKEEVQFFFPDGRPVSEVPAPPVLGEEPVEDLLRSHEEAGIRPDAWTPTPDWHGEPLDYGLAIDMLWKPRKRPES
jgi:hypothetical protein